MPVDCLSMHIVDDQDVSLLTPQASEGFKGRTRDIDNDRTVMSVCAYPTYLACGEVLASEDNVGHSS